MRQEITSPSFFIGQQQHGLISFGSGQPDLPPPQGVFDALNEYTGFKYGPVQGDVRLRSALAKEYPGARAEDIVITNGASEALDLTLRAIRRLTDRSRVVLPKPYYYSYPPVIRYAGFEADMLELAEGRINPTLLPEHMHAAAAMLINSPSNPTGRVEAIETLKIIERSALNERAWIISDEVYKDIIYERENYVMSGPHVVTINSFSKTFGMCGIRVGYCYSRDTKLIAEIVEMKTHTSMNTSIVAQEMALAATRTPRAHILAQANIWKARRDRMVAGLRGLGLSLWEPEGAFYVLPEFPNADQAVEDLYYDHHVIVYNGAWFGAPGRIRLSYALDIPMIDEGLGRIGAYLETAGHRLNTVFTPEQDIESAPVSSA